MRSDTLAVEMRSCVKRFGEVCALDRIDVQVASGEVRGLLGPNGAGKTTLLRVLFGLVRADAGSVRVFGRSWSDSDASALDGVAGFVEDPRFYPYLSARDNLALLARLDGLSAASRVDELLELVGLPERRCRKVGTFSSGMRQRLGIAAALLRAPRLLLLDEPTVGLDPAGARDVRALLRSLAARGVTVLLSSHDMVEVDGLCDSVTIMRSGRVIWDGTIARLRSEAPAPSHRMWTSDNRRALALARSQPGISVAPAADGGLTVAAGPIPLDDYVLALGAAGIAVRRLELPVGPLEAMFFRLTANASPEDRSEPARQRVGAAS